MDTLTFEVRCRPKQSSLVTILLTMVPLNCEAVLNQTDCETYGDAVYGSWLKDAFTITSICPSFFFGPPLNNIIFFVVLNSSPSSRTYLFRNVHQLACAILKCVNSAISIYVNLHEMSLVPNTSPHLLNITRIAERRFLTGLPRGYFFWGEGAAIHTKATIKPCRQPLHATEPQVRLKHKLIQNIERLS